MKKRLIFSALLLSVCLLIQAQQDLQIDLKNTPFSCYGSYMALSVEKVIVRTDSQKNKLYEKWHELLFVDKDAKGEEKLFLRDLSGSRWREGDMRIFDLEVLDNGKIVKPVISATPTVVSLKVDNRQIDICFQDPDALRIRGEGLGLRITQVLLNRNCLVIPVKEGQWRLQMGSSPHYAFTTIKGDVTMDGSSILSLAKAGNMDQEHPEAVITLLPGKDGIMEAAIEQYPFGWRSKEFTKSFSSCVNDMQESLNNWISKSPEVPAEYKETAYLASYINWSCVVQKRGFLKRTVMYSSKNKMVSIWAWDCNFYSIANSYHQPEFAWDQYMVFFDQQNEHGSFPAYLNDSWPKWGFHQPPVQGWALIKMIEANPEIASLKNFREIYTPLKKWTNFWFDYMDDDNNGLPQVNHGFDSWDNATVFDVGYSVEPPDLYAYLILQMDALAMIAEKLGINDEAGQWKKRSNHLLTQLVDTFWNGETFIYRRTGDHIRNEESQSLMPYLPLVLGDRLPKKIRKKMLNDLKSPDGPLTSIGLASESPGSPLFIPDGYWRGAIWAVSTLIMADAIWESGDKKFAREIAKRFCDNCRKHGFGETYHPITGESLRDNSLPWSAAPFLIMAHRYLQ